MDVGVEVPFAAARIRPARPGWRSYPARVGARLALLTLPAWYGGYLLLAFPPQAADLVAGAAVAGLGAVATQAALVAAGRRFAWPPGLAAELVRLPWQVLRGYVR